MMRNIKLVIQYDGTNYHGWQIQTQHDTIQGQLVTALRQMVTTYPVKCIGASRTDAGVHALGQVAHVRMPPEISISCSSFFHGLNSLTPDDIIIKDVQDVQPNFHARFDARAKTYCYQILNAASGSIYHLRFAWHIRHALNIPAMRAAAKHVLGCHDFAAFQASSCDAETSIRTISALHIVQRKQLIRIFVKANAYLHHMVRILVGTLVEVGSGRRSPDDVLRILQSQDRTLSGVTAPARGLFLVNVHY